MGEENWRNTFFLLSNLRGFFEGIPSVEEDASVPEGREVKKLWLLSDAECFLR